MTSNPESLEQKPAREAVVKEIASSEMASLRGKLTILSLAISLAFLPLVYHHLREGGSGHWTTIVWSLVALLFAFTRGKPFESMPDQSRVRLSLATFAISVLVGMYACWSFLGWCGLLALVGCLVAVGLVRFRNPWPEVFGWGLLATVAAGVPYDFVPFAETWIADIALATAAASLDLLGTPNLVSGTLLETDGLKIFTEPVLSGFANVQFVVGAGLAMAIYWRQSLCVGIKLVFHAAVWLCFAKTVQLLITVYFFQSNGRDLTSGSDLTLLSAGICCIAVGLSYLSLLVLKALTAPVYGTVEEFGPALERMNTVLRWPQAIPDRVGGGALSAQSKKVEPRLATRSDLANLTRVLLAGTCVVGVLGLLCFVVVFRGTASPRSADELELPGVAALINSTQIPADRDNLRRLTEQDEDSESEQRGQRWRFLYDGRIVEFLVDLPYQGWEDPVQPLTMIGWNVRARAKSKEEWPYIVTALETDLGSNAYMFVSCLNEQGTPLEILPRVSQSGTLMPLNLASNLWGLLTGSPRLETVPNAQVRLYCEAGEDLTRLEREQLKELFLELRSALIAGAPSES